MKILKCITNSFFRTIGRILAYLVIGALLVTLLSKADLPSFDEIINDTLFMRVNASTTYTTEIRTQLYEDSSLTTLYEQIEQSPTLYGVAPSARMYGQDALYHFYFSSISLSNVDEIRITGKLSHSTVAYEDHTYSIMGYAQGGFGAINCTTMYNNGNSAYFELRCPIVGTNTYINSIHINIRFENVNDTLLQFGISPFFTLVNNNSNSIPSAIQSQTSDITSNANQNTQSIINNQNSNNQAIINSNEANTNATIENQNQNTQQQIDSQMVCEVIDKNDIYFDNKYINANDGTEISNNNFGITDYIRIDNTYKLEMTKSDTRWAVAGLCFYNNNKQKISCLYNKDYSVGDIIPIANNSFYVRFTINKDTNLPQFNMCQNGNQALSNSLNDTNVSDSTNQADSFFSNFSTADQGGLSGIITAPLSAIQSLTSSTCSPLVIPLPYIDENLTLPCMRSIYESFFGNFIYLYDTITIGIISYWVIVRIFNLVKDFKNPDHDEIEVLDL